MPLAAMKYFICYLASCASLASFSSRLEAPMPPEALALVEAESSADQQIDQNLQKWFAMVDRAQEPLIMEQQSFETFTSQQTLTHRLYLQWLRANDQNERSKLEALQTELLSHIKSESFRVDDPLADYLLFSLYRYRKLPPQEVDYLSSRLKLSPHWSCPKREHLTMQLNEDRAQTLTLEQFKQFIDRIQAMRPERYQREAWESLLELADPKEHGSLRAELYSHVRKYPKLINDHGWLLDPEASTTLSKPVGKFAEALEQIGEQVDRRRCNTAKAYLKKAIRLDEKAEHFNEISGIVNDVDRCFRRRGTRARLRFLKAIDEPLKKKYGFAGEELALRPQGLIYWGDDEFVKARKVFDKILEQAKKAEDKTILARNLYTYARIDENEGSLLSSIARYRDFIDRFPKHENINSVLTSLVVLASITNQNDMALDYARQIINRENELALSERDGATMSFGLFWAGKLSLSSGNRPMAEEYWRRLASEYYSTFYGALGHYMLETVIGKKFLLQPVRATAFDFEHLKSPLTVEEKHTVARIEQLVSFGLKDDAACEARALVIDDQRPQLALIKSMLLYAAGEWLAAIQTYSDIPRNYRNTLPAGMERLLFPKAYEPIVSKYAQKLDIPEEYIYAIIRQESVFNPRARSPVGASGLMQLMPATARMEAQRLSRGYISSKSRRDIVQRARKRSQLFDAETNIALGVHHVYRLYSRYRNPVFVLTSYNANPRATEKWLENLDTSNMLAFIERIPYKETRAYVKLVMRNYFYYKRWYSGYEKPTPFMESIAPTVFELAKGEAAPGKVEATLISN